MADRRRSLTHTSPWAGHWPPGRVGPAPAGVSVTPRDGGCLHVLALRRGNEADRGLTLPPPGGSAVVDGGRVAGIGPDRWLILGEPPAHLPRCAGLVDVSDAFAAVDVGGPQARAALAKGCQLDLHPRAFAADAAAACIIAHISVLIVHIFRPPAGGRLRSSGSSCPRSMTGSFSAWLVASAAEFGCEICAEEHIP